MAGQAQTPHLPPPPSSAQPQVWESQSKPVASEALPPPVPNSAARAGHKRQLDQDGFAEVRPATSRRKVQSPSVTKSSSQDYPRTSRAAPVQGYQTASSRAQPVNSRDAATSGAIAANNAARQSTIRPAKAFAKYVEYDLSKMTDTKGGFISTVDDPTNRVLAPNTDDPLAGKPQNMSAAEWERHKLLEHLRANKTGPFEPGVSLLNAHSLDAKKCRECGDLNVDTTWVEVFGCAVCHSCKKEYPEKYSLLTKTEVREDYLITDPELRDEKLLRRLERPNPHKQHWNSMLLFLRYQVEEYAFGPRKWKSAEALDEEFQRRLAEKGKRKEKKFKTKLETLKSRTRTEAMRRAKAMENDGTAATDFGDKIRTRNGAHEHEWGNPVSDSSTGLQVKKCLECGMEVEQLEL